MKNQQNKTIVKANLIGQDDHRFFTELQAAYGIAQRGGSIPSNFSNTLAKRISNDVNLLNRDELKQLIFRGNSFNN